MKTMYVEATKAKDGVWDLKGECPYCHKNHQHGGGRDREPFLGSRLAHCESLNNGSYMLQVKS